MEKKKKASFISTVSSGISQQTAAKCKNKSPSASYCRIGSFLRTPVAEGHI